MHLLSVKNLNVDFETSLGTGNAVRNVSFDLEEGKTLALVGESGSGKSVSALSILKLLPMPPAKIKGRILYQKKDLLSIPYEKLVSFRGEEISMIFQDPMNSLNPVLKVGDQIIETLVRKKGFSKKIAKEKALLMMQKVGISDTHKRFQAYPHQLSGGMNQRMMICQALINEPKLLIADEPTTALDVTIQAQVLEMINQLKQSMKMSVLFITHNLALAYEYADEICVMYAGEIVEKQSVKTIFKNPCHPYTKGLLQAIPKINLPKQKLKPIAGHVPSIMKMPTGCRFHPRCEKVMEVCAKESPRCYHLKKRSHFVSCWLFEKKSS